LEIGSRQNNQISGEQKPMILLENVKRIAEKATGWCRPNDPQALLRERKPQSYRFTDDGLIPNHPKWPLIIYKGAVRLPQSLDAAAVFEELFDSRGWGSSWRDGIHNYVHYHSRIHEVLGIARGSGRVQFGGTKGRALTLKAGDVAILPAGTGRQRLKASEDFLVVERTRPRAPMTNAHRWKIARRRFPQLPGSRARARTPFTARMAP
jgi:uncharacterized protein YjlB